MLEGQADHLPTEWTPIDGVTVGYGSDEGMFDSWGASEDWWETVPPQEACTRFRVFFPDDHQTVPRNIVDVMAALEFDRETSKQLATGEQIAFTASVSLLNPHAILDTISVIGTNALSYTGIDRLVHWPRRSGSSCRNECWSHALDGVAELRLCSHHLGSGSVHGLAADSTHPITINERSRKRADDTGD